MDLAVVRLDGSVWRGRPLGGAMMMFECKLSDDSKVEMRDATE